MTRIQHVHLPVTSGARSGLVVCLAALIILLVAGFAETLAAQPSVRALGGSRWLTPPSGDAYDVQVSGKYAYVSLGSAGFAVFDVSDPANIARVGGDETVGIVEASVLVGNYAYLAMRPGVQVMDVSNPSNCTRVVRFATNDVGNLAAVAVAGHYAYVVDIPSRLQEYDISNLTNIVYTRFYAVPAQNMLGVTVSNNYAYVACGIGGLYVVQLHTNTSGHFFDANGSVRTIALSGNYAYVGAASGGLSVLDISNPTNIVRVGGYDTPGLARTAALRGKYAYMADGLNGFAVIDVSDPTNCVWLGGFDTLGEVRSVAVASSGICVADADGFMVVPAISNVQFTVRVEAETNQPFTLEAATDLSGSGNWSPLITTNVPAMPFDFVDFEVKFSDKPRKFYRVRQP